MGIIGALGLGDDHVAPGLQRRRTSKPEETYFGTKGYSLSIDPYKDEVDLNDFRGNLYKETLSPNTIRQKQKLSRRLEASKASGDASSRGEFLLTSLDNKDLKLKPRMPAGSTQVSQVKNERNQSNGF